MVKAVVLGAAGGIGQPLSLLLKLSPYLSELSLYDIRMAPGVAADLSHVSSKVKVTGYQPESPQDDEALGAALKGADLVIIPAGIPRKPGMTRADLFKVNAGIVRGLVSGVARHAPKAVVLVISNPVNSTVPVACETLKKHGVFDASKLFGVTTLDTVRAETFLAEILKKSPESIRGEITVVGGHSGDTIVPLIDGSELTNEVKDWTNKEYEKYVKRVQFGGDEVVKAKQGAGSATLSMAFAGYRFAENILRSMAGERQEAKDSAFVYLPGIPGGKEVQKQVGVDYFAVPIEFGAGGKVVSVVDVLKNASSREKKLVKVALGGLKESIGKGVVFGGGSKL